MGKMASDKPFDELRVLYESLMPALSKAAIGEFDSEIKVDPANSERVNELLVGVQVLLEVTRDKIAELEAINADLADSRDRSVMLLDDVLRKSLELD
jgi:hypothetical protein